MRVREVLVALGFLVLVAAGPVAAQGGSITGVVRSGTTSAPVAGANVQLFGPDGGQAAGVQSDQSGRYQLTGLAGGTYSVLVSAVGYSTSRVSGIRAAPGQSVTVNVELVRSVVDLDPLVVSPSRRAERALEAPARVEVVTGQEVRDQPAASPVEHLRSLAGVDIASSGIQSANVVARGFNNVFSGALYALTDHRIAGVPSLRVNLLHFIPSTDEDVERMEVVLGPGSALYGPNTANGVLHILTRSPLSAPSTTVSVMGGERSFLQGMFRVSQPIGDRFGVKVSGQALRADEWQYVDPVEASERAKFTSRDSTFWRTDLMRSVGVSEAQARARIGRIGSRDYELNRWSADARADWRITPDLTAVFSAGTTTSNGIELTGLGAGQAQDWRYSYYQARASWNRAFGQVYVNSSDAGDTYLLRNGAPITDKSKLVVAQLQHGLSLGERQSFTYGTDFLYTLPVTEGTINGSYEEDDEVRELGAYLQSETTLSSMFDLVLAGRLDTHSALPEPVFSPRAALVFKPAPDQVFRASFNRAFSTPNALNQFLDLGTPIPDLGGARLGYSLRVQGTGSEGFQFRQGDGSYQIRSPFNPAGGGMLLPAQSARAFWPAAIAVVAAQAAARGQPLAPQTIAFLSRLNPSPVQLSYFYPASTKQQGGLLSSLAVEGVDPIRESTSNTFELGYKGLLGGRILIAADLWYSKRENLITPLTITTPFVGFEQASTVAFLSQALRQAGFPAPVAQAQAQALGGGIAQVPVGVISSADVNANAAQLLVTYFNVDDDVDLYGSDLSATALLGRDWSVELATSLVNKDVFTSRQGDRITLNAPKRKGSLALNYRNEGAGLNAEGRVRYNAAYPVDSGVYKATACLGDTTSDVEPCIDDFTLVDLTLGYRVPRRTGTSIQLSVQNLLDDEYRSFPGAPKIGRLALLRLKYEH